MPNIFVRKHTAITVQSAYIVSSCIKHSCPLLQPESSLMRLTRPAVARLMDTPADILMTSLVKLSQSHQASRGLLVSG